MTILKLPNAGDNAHLTITACEVVQGTYGEQVKFDAANGDTLYVPKESAVRQLLRCGYDSGVNDETGKPVPHYGDVVGDTLLFSRDANPKPGAKPFWSITVSSPGDARALAPSKRLTQAAAQKAAPEEDDGYGPIDETPKSAPLIDRIKTLTGDANTMDKQATERARLTAGIMLYGMSMIYGMTGSLNISEIAAALQSESVAHLAGYRRQR